MSDSQTVTLSQIESHLWESIGNWLTARFAPCMPQPCRVPDGVGA